MPDKDLVSLGSKSFEDLKKTNEYGAAYWSARDIQPLLGYTQWRRFEDAIKRAIISCNSSGNNPDHHFAGAGKMIDIGKGGSRDVTDYHLSRFACYLIPKTAIPVNRKLPMLKNILPSRHAARKFQMPLPLIWKGWSCAKIPRKNLKLFPGRRAKQV